MFVDMDKFCLFESFIKDSLLRPSFFIVFVFASESRPCCIRIKYPMEKGTEMWVIISHWGIKGFLDLCLKRSPPFHVQRLKASYCLRPNMILELSGETLRKGTNLLEDFSCKNTHARARTCINDLVHDLYGTFPARVCSLICFILNSQLSLIYLNNLNMVGYFKKIIDCNSNS